jgi:hypothetical protein
MIVSKKGVLMINLIDTSRIPTIKKQIFLLLGLFCSWSHLGAMCPQTVGATIPGEGLWNVLTRVGAATNVIESQLCALSVGNPNLACTFVFGQTDIGSGGIYTISEPGTYCMSEDVTFTFGPAITINASNVTLDLQGHYLDGGSNQVPSAIQIATGVGSNLHSITIQNGTIQNLSGSSPFTHGIGQGGTNSNLANVVIRDMDFYNLVGLSFGISYALYLTVVQSVLIENCATFNGGAMVAFINPSGSAVVRNIRVEQYNQGFSEILVESNLGNLVHAASVVVEDCIITTSAPALSFAFVEVNYTANAVVRNCVTNGGTDAGAAVGFYFLNVDNLVVSDCIAQNCSAPGFIISAANSVSVVIERCIAQYNGAEGFRITTNGLGSLNMIDCVANNNLLNGFVVNPFSLLVDATTFKNCFAAQNGECGFLLTNANGSGAILNSSFDGCVAQGNSGDGFNLDNIAASIAAFPFVNISFNDCVSQANSGGVLGAGGSIFLGDGFGVNSATNAGRHPNATIKNVVFNNCVAQQNGNDGFDFGATGTSGRVDTIVCNYCTAENNASHGMNFSSTSTNCQVYMSFLNKNGRNGINNLNPTFGPSSANRFLSNRSLKNAGVDYFQINNGVNGQPFFSSSNEAFIQGASAWASLSS